MSVEFRKQNTLGSGWALEVRRAGVLIGHIRQRPDTQAYCYFRGPGNELTSHLEQTDLEVLKKLVAENP